MINRTLSDKSNLIFCNTPLRLLAGLGRIVVPKGRIIIIIYSALMGFVAAPMLLLWPRLEVHYFVRGDEYFEKTHRRRRLRAWLVHCGQRILRRRSASFVYVSWDVLRAVEARVGVTNGSILPNSIGAPVPESRAFDGRVAVIGDFNSVKNIEFVIESLAGTPYTVHVFGNEAPSRRSLPSNVVLHGRVKDLVSALRSHASLVAFSSLSEGFPNAALDALQAGCSITVPTVHPFAMFPVSDQWKYEPNPAGLRSNLADILIGDRRFTSDNQLFVEIATADWSEKLCAVLGL